MPSEVDIANVALSRIGDDATVSSFDPPEGSAQADHCAKFYPIARDSLLEMYEWNWATTRDTLAPLDVTPPGRWRYVYACPSDMLKALNVFPPDQLISVDPISGQQTTNSLMIGGGRDYDGRYIASQSQDFELETLKSTGVKVIYTNQQSAVLRYTRRVIDTALFSPLFSDTLGWLLGGYLAGPVIKGQSSIKVAASCMQMAQFVMAQAKNADASQRESRDEDYKMKPSWMRNR